MIEKIIPAGHYKKLILSMRGACGIRYSYYLIIISLSVAVFSGWSCEKYKKQVKEYATR